MSGMDNLKAAVANANTVMDGAATLIGGLRQRLAAAQAEVANAGANSPELDGLKSDLDTHAAALTSALAENTSAAPAESPTPESAPVVDPAAAPTG